MRPSQIPDSGSRFQFQDFSFHVLQKAVWAVSIFTMVLALHYRATTKPDCPPSFLHYL